MLRHSLIAYRDDAPGDGGFPRFEGEEWLRYVPIRLPEAVCLRERLPAGAAAVLINRAHGYRDLFLPIDVEQLRLYEAIDGKTTITGLLERVAGGKRHPACGNAPAFSTGSSGSTTRWSFNVKLRERRTHVGGRK